MLKIFEFKVYPFSQEEFSKKIDSFREDKIKELMSYGRTRESARDSFTHLYEGRKLCYENYSLGVINVFFEQGNLQYESQIMLEEKRVNKKSIEKQIDELKNVELTDKEKSIRIATIKNSFRLVPYRTRLFSGVKHYMKDHHINGLYTQVSNLSNKDIFEAIKCDIKNINEYDDIFKNLYVDTSLFDTIGEYIDYRSIFDNID